MLRLKILTNNLRGKSQLKRVLGGINGKRANNNECWG